MKIETIIVEDEQESLGLLKSILNDLEHITLVDSAMDGETAVKKINTKRPDLVFLDIELPEMSGLEVLENIEYDPYIIFCTAYNKYAVKAFDINSVDYILKPVSIDRIKKAIENVLEKEQKIKEEILNVVGKVSDKTKKITVSVGDRLIVIPIDKIYFFTKEETYTMLYTFDKNYIYEESLKIIEDKLKYTSFIRIHRSYIININKIKHLKKRNKWYYNVIMGDKKQTTIQLSKKYKKILFEKMGIQ